MQANCGEKFTKVESSLNPVELKRPIWGDCRLVAAVGARNGRACRWGIAPVDGGRAHEGEVGGLVARSADEIDIGYSVGDGNAGDFRHGFNDDIVNPIGLVVTGQTTSDIQAAHEEVA